METRIRKATVVELAIQKIYELIKEKNLKENDRLPTEYALTKMLGISRPSLREAIRVLNMFGIIRVDHGSGMVIDTKGLSESVLLSLNFALMLNRSSHRELFEARKMIEVECAGLAAERASEEDLCRLEQKYEQMRLSGDDRERAIQLEVDFHECIADAAKNIIIKKMLFSIRELLRESMHSTVPPSGISEATLGKHRELIEAFRTGNREMARSSMLRHLEEVYRRLESVDETLHSENGKEGTT
jgi:GntR family transcriptional repressor for pyruvate dehydrogenase complex